MSVTAHAVSVGTSAARLDTIEGGANRTTSVAVYNNGTAIVYVGDSAVTTATGFPIAVGGAMSFDIDTTEGLYGRATAGTHDVRVIEGGV